MQFELLMEKLGEAPLKLLKEHYRTFEKLLADNLIKKLLYLVCTSKMDNSNSIWIRWQFYHKTETQLENCKVEVCELTFDNKFDFPWAVSSWAISKWTFKLIIKFVQFRLSTLQVWWALWISSPVRWKLIVIETSWWSGRLEQINKRFHLSITNINLIYDDDSEIFPSLVPSSVERESEHGNDIEMQCFDTKPWTLDEIWLKIDNQR